MVRGIVETFGLAGSVLFAAPVALFGADLLGRGDAAIGGAFLAIAALMVLFPRYVWTPGDAAGDVAEKTAERVVKTDDDE